MTSGVPAGWVAPGAPAPPLPPPGAPGAGGVIRRERVTLPSQDRLLAGTVVSAPVPSGAGVLFVHGLGSSRMTNVERAEAVAQAHAATCLALDLGGHGESTGSLSRMTPRGNLADAVAGFDLLAGLAGVDRDRIGVCAASYGAYLSVLLSALRPVSRLLLRAPALYADDSFDRPLGQRLRGDAGTAPTLLAHVALFPGRLLVVESERDEVIGADTIAAYLAAARPGVAHVVQAGAAHALTDPVWRSQFQQVVVEFLAGL